MTTITAGKTPLEEFADAVAAHPVDNLKNRAAACIYLKVENPGKTFDAALKDEIVKLASNATELAVLKEVEKGVDYMKINDGVTTSADLKSLLDELAKCDYLDQEFFFPVLNSWIDKSKKGGSLTHTSLQAIIEDYINKAGSSILVGKLIPILEEHLKIHYSTIPKASLEKLIDHIPKNYHKTAYLIGEYAGKLGAADVGGLIEKADLSRYGKSELIANIVVGTVKYDLTNAVLRAALTKAFDKDRTSLTIATRIVSTSLIDATKLEAEVSTSMVDVTVKNLATAAKDEAVLIGSLLTDETSSASFQSTQAATIDTFLEYLTINSVWAKRLVAAKFLKANSGGKASLKEAGPVVSDANIKKILEWVKDNKAKDAIRDDIPQAHLEILMEQNQDARYVGRFDASSYFRSLQLQVNRSEDTTTRSRLVLTSTLEYAAGGSPNVSKHFHGLLPTIAEDPSVLKEVVASKGTDTVEAITKVILGADKKEEAGKNLTEVFKSLPDTNQKDLVTKISTDATTKVADGKTEAAHVLAGLIEDKDAKAAVDNAAATNATLKSLVADAVTIQTAPKPSTPTTTTTTVIEQAVQKYLDEIKKAESILHITIDTLPSSILPFQSESNRLEDQIPSPQDLISPSPSNSDLSGPISDISTVSREAFIKDPSGIIDKLPETELSKITPAYLNELDGSAIAKIPPKKLEKLNIGSITNPSLIESFKGPQLAVLVLKMESHQCALLSADQVKSIEADSELSSSFHKTCASSNSGAQFVASWILSAGFGLVGLLFLLM